MPHVPTHPAHIIVSVLDKNENRWKVIKETGLPRVEPGVALFEATSGIHRFETTF